MLLRRRMLSAVEAIERLVGMQAQAPAPPYVGLWTRFADFDPDELGRMISSRRAVRIALMRNTVHLVSARDCHALRPLMRTIIERNLYSSRARRADLEGVEHRGSHRQRPHAARGAATNLQGARRAVAGAVARPRPRIPRPRHPSPATAGPGPSKRRLGEERASRPHHGRGLARQTLGSGFLPRGDGNALP